MTNSEVITISSQHSVPVTIDRLASQAESHGLTIFARIDHAQNATEVNLPLRPTLLLIFGNPKGGTPLMQDKQTAGLDLPLRALAWQGEKEQVWLSYCPASVIAQRHHLGVTSALAVEAIDKGLGMLCPQAADQDISKGKRRP